MKRKPSFPWSLVAAAAVAGASFAGVAGYVQNVRKQPLEASATPATKALQNPENQDQQSNQSSEENASRGGSERNSKRQIVITRMACLRQSLEESGFKRIRVLGIDTVQGNAIIDLSPSVRSGFGSSEEAQFLDAIKSGLSRFKEIKTFQLRVDGQILDALSHSEVGEPTPVR